MLIVSAGNHRFRSFQKHSLNQTKKFGYDSLTYDLGNLGFGEAFAVPDKSFQINGYYNTVDYESGQKTRAMHKPRILLASLGKSDLYTYLDGDAFLVQNIDEIADEKFDIGVTVRDPKEDPKLGKINAGVIFYREKAKNFLSRWQEETELINNDQIALNKLLPVDKPNKSYSLHGIKVRTFPTSIYNYYYFEKKPSNKVKILHYKSKDWIRDLFNTNHLSQN